MNQALQLGDPQGRLDILAVRLLECAIKARYGAPAESTLTVDLLHIGEVASRRVGFQAFSSLRPQLEALAKEYGVSTEQTLPELAQSVGLLKCRARAKRGHSVNRVKVTKCTG
jgi:hypothetical protein